MRAIHVISSIHDTAAGTTYAVEHLCETLGQRGIDVALHTLEPLPHRSSVNYQRVGYPQGVPARLGVSNTMRIGLFAAASGADIIHNHGLWLMPNIYAGVAARRARCKFVVSVHGMLARAALKRSRWKKTIFSRMGQQASLESAACFHATSKDEYHDIRRLGFRQPVSIVPLGVEVPQAVPKINRDRKTLLFLGRIHPIKRIDLLLEAWCNVQKMFPSWELVICGPDNDGYLQELRRKATQLKAKSVDFVGAKYGDEKEGLLAQSDLLVLPSFSENFGVVVAEALAYGVPAIVTNTAPWAALEAHRCGWWIEIGHQTLEACLREALAMDASALQGMGARGREWMIQDFSWEKVAEMMDLTYQWLLGRIARPEWVLLD